MSDKPVYLTTDNHNFIKSLSKENRRTIQGQLNFYLDALRARHEKKASK